MKNFGFTLAEILVTMGIIGVVAAMTAPVLMTNVKNQSYATKLRTTVNDLENAFSMAIAAEKAEDLWGTSIAAPGAVSFGDAGQNALVNSLRNYLKIGTVGQVNSSVYYTQNGTALHNMTNAGGVGNVTTINNHIPIVLKNGSIMFIRTVNDNAHPDLVAYINIDVNGLDDPNVRGRDVFLFDLVSDGTLTPEGSARAHEVSGASLYNNLCLIQENASALCTARLVENNYHFDY